MYVVSWIFWVSSTNQDTTTKTFYSIFLYQMDGHSFLFIIFYYVSLFKGKKIFSLRLIENKDLCKWAQYDMLDSFCCDRNDFNNCLFEYVWTLSMFMYLAFIGRVRISSPTPSTSTTSDSWYVLTVLEHSVTCTNIAQTYNKTTNTPIHRQDNKCLRLKRKESSLMSPSALKTPVSTE